MYIHGSITRKLCVATFISNKQKCHIFLFSSIKAENRRQETVLPRLAKEMAPVGWER
jgi:hypothetical protein